MIAQSRLLVSRKFWLCSSLLGVVVMAICGFVTKDIVFFYVSFPIFLLSLFLQIQIFSEHLVSLRGKIYIFRCKCGGWVNVRQTYRQSLGVSHAPTALVCLCDKCYEPYDPETRDPITKEAKDEL